jgi:hypothetical protein
MRTNVIIVNGLPRSGKDTAIELMQHLMFPKIAARSYSSIDPVRNVLADWGVDLSAKTEEDRKLMSTIGDALEEHSNFKTEESFKKVLSFQEGAGLRDLVVFIQIREPDLIDKLKRRLEDVDIPVTRLKIQSSRGLKLTSNPADAGIDEMVYDRLIQNDSDLDDLKRDCKGMLKSIGVL